MHSTSSFVSELSDAEWQRLINCFPELVPRQYSRGRPCRDVRSVLNGVLWALGSGEPWRAMPQKYPPFQTCHRRHKAWRDAGMLERMIPMLYAWRLLELRGDVRHRIRRRHAGAVGGYDARYGPSHVSGWAISTLTEHRPIPG